MNTPAAAAPDPSTANPSTSLPLLSTPSWFQTPPKNNQKSLFFVGDANGAPDEATARDLAVNKALAQLTVYCGATIKSDSRSLERETNGQLEQVVSMTVDVAGDELTVKEAVVRNSVAGKNADGRYDAYALLEWPREQYDAVLRAQRARATRALDLFLRAESAERDLDLPKAKTDLKEAKAILGPMKSQVPLEHASYKNTSLLFDAMTALDERLRSTERERKGVFAVAVECVREGKPTDCHSSRAGALRQALSRTGRKVAAESIPASVAHDILSSENPNTDKAVRSAGFVVAVRYTADLQAIDGPFTFIRYGARGVLYDTSTNRIISVEEVTPTKEGHPTFEGAMEKGFSAAEKALTKWIEEEIPNLK